jgi:hypothetical protein
MNDGDNGRKPQRSRPRPVAVARNRGYDDTSARAQPSYEKYLALARNALARGDAVEMEDCYQHAEHFLRVMKERAAQNLQPAL